LFIQSASITDYNVTGTNNPLRDIVGQVTGN
jgi:hypothetical protein